jgi:hypothetical protein
VRHAPSVEVAPEAALDDDPELALAWADMGTYHDAHPCECEALCECAPPVEHQLVLVERTIGDGVYAYCLPCRWSGPVRDGTWEAGLDADGHRDGSEG